MCFDGCDGLMSKLSVESASITDCIIDIHGSSCVRMEDVGVVARGGLPDNVAVIVDGCGGKGARLTARSSNFHSSQGSGLQVHRGGAAVLDGTRCDGNGQCGFAVLDDGSMLVAHSGSSASGNECNVEVSEAGRAEIVESRLEGCTVGPGLLVSDARSAVKARECSISCNQLHNAMATSCARLSLYDCVCDDSREYDGLSALGQGAFITANSCSISNNQLNNAWAGEGGKVELKDCKCDGSKVENGLIATGQGSSATAHACSISSNKQHNVWACDGASMTLQDCESHGSDGCGLRVSNSGSFATASMCCFSRNQQHNVWVGDSGVAELRDCSFGS